MDVCDCEGWCVMYYVSVFGCVDVVEVLVWRYGVEVDVEDDDGRGALTYAAANARDECVKFLIDMCDVWIDVSDCNDDMVLMVVCR